MSSSINEPIRIKAIVREINRSRNIVRFESRAGIPISIRLPNRHPGWNQLIIGTEFEILVHSSLSGGSKYEVLLPSKRTAEKEPQRETSPAKEKRPLVTPIPKDEPEQPQSQDQQFVGQTIGIDPDYFREREQEGHRHEIMAFLREHLNDEFIEWYQMQPAQAAKYGTPKSPLNKNVETVLRQDQNFQQLYLHQAKALDSIRAGRNLVIVTQTASGKTLCYNPAIFEHFCSDGTYANALYVFPLNALMMDQNEKIQQLSLALQRKGVNVRTAILNY